jgi:hypothetical protein
MRYKQLYTTGAAPRIQAPALDTASSSICLLPVAYEDEKRLFEMAGDVGLGPVI